MIVDNVQIESTQPINFHLTSRYSTECGKNLSQKPRFLLLKEANKNPYLSEDNSYTLYLTDLNITKIDDEFFGFISKVQKPFLYFTPFNELKPFLEKINFFKKIRFFADDECDTLNVEILLNNNLLLVINRSKDYPGDNCLVGVNVFNDNNDLEVSNIIPIKQLVDLINE